MSISDYPEVETLSDQDILILDNSTDGTTKISVGDIKRMFSKPIMSFGDTEATTTISDTDLMLLFDTEYKSADISFLKSTVDNLITSNTPSTEPSIPMTDYNNFTYHRNCPRGKNLGSSITEEQLLSIEQGTFDDIFVLDYWTASDGTEWVVIDINYFKALTFTKNHLVVMPRFVIPEMSLNDGSTSIVDGCINTKAYTTYADAAKSKASLVFGENLLAIDMKISNFFHVNGFQFGMSNYYGYMGLLTEGMVYGTAIYNRHAYKLSVPSNDSRVISGLDLDKGQMVGFILDPGLMSDQFALRSQVISNSFATAGFKGIYVSNSIDDTKLKPYFLVGR